MSFIAVLALIVAGQGLLERGRGPLSRAAGLLGTGLVVTAALAPITGSLYGCVRIHAPLSTLVSMPFMVLTMLFGALCLLPVAWQGASKLAEWTVFLWLELLDLLDLGGLRASGASLLAGWLPLMLLLLLFRRGLRRTLARLL